MREECVLRTDDHDDAVVLSESAALQTTASEDNVKLFESRRSRVRVFRDRNLRSCKPCRRCANAFNRLISSDQRCLGKFLVTMLVVILAVYVSIHLHIRYVAGVVSPIHNNTPDKTTILMMGYSPERKPNVEMLLDHYSKGEKMNSLVDRVVIVWCHPQEPPPQIKHPRVKIVMSADRSMNARWSELADPLIRTETVLVVDDDLMLPAEFVARMMHARQKYRYDGRLIGFDRRWIGRNKDTYKGTNIFSDAFYFFGVLFGDQTVSDVDITLTRTVLVPKHFLAAYRSEMDIVQHVEKVKNCEDIGMNAVARRLGAPSPIVITGFDLPEVLFGWIPGLGASGYVRWELDDTTDVAISSTPGHYQKRNECVRKFYAAETSSNAAFRTTPGSKSDMCYVSLLSDDKLLTEMRVLGRSLLETGTGGYGRSPFEHDQHPMIALLTSEVSANAQRRLEEDGWTTKRLAPRRARHGRSASYPSRWTGMYSLRHAIKLKSRCARIVLLDVHTLVLKNPNEMFKACPGFCAVMREHGESFGSGVMVIASDEMTGDALTSDIVTAYQHMGNDDDDERMLNALFSKMTDAPLIIRVDGSAKGSTEYEFRVEQVKDSDRKTTQHGVTLARLPSACNAKIDVSQVSRPWQQSTGAREEAYVLNYAFDSVKPWLRFLNCVFPTFVVWGSEETRNILLSFPYRKAALVMLMALFVARVLRVQITKHVPVAAFDGIALVSSRNETCETSLSRYGVAIAHVLATIMITRCLPSFALGVDEIRGVLYAIYIFLGVAVCMECFVCVWIVCANSMKRRFGNMAVISAAALLPSSWTLAYAPSLSVVAILIMPRLIGLLPLPAMLVFVLTLGWSVPGFLKASLLLHGEILRSDLRQRLLPKSRSWPHQLSAAPIARMS